MIEFSGLFQIKKNLNFWELLFNINVASVALKLKQKTAASRLSKHNINCIEDNMVVIVEESSELTKMYIMVGPYS